MSRPMRVGVLASGSGSNLQALLDRFNLGDDSGARVAIVVGTPQASTTNRPAANPTSPPKMLALTIQAVAVDRISVGNNSDRCEPNAGPKANAPTVETKMPRPISQPASKK